MIIQSQRIWIDDLFIPGQIVMEDGKIKSIDPYGMHTADLDFGAKRIVPGFLDLHTHGSYGYDTWNGGKDDIAKWLDHLPAEGVTGICPTIMTPKDDVMVSALSAIRDCRANRQAGSEILGIHIEGTCIQHHKDCDNAIENFKRYQLIADNLIQIVTVDPEKDEQFALTKYCASQSVCVSLGHCSPTYDCSVLAYANGANGITHVFNGMGMLNSRKQGLINIALQMDHLYGEIICDGKDVTMDIYQLYFKTKKDRAIMITDSFALKGLPCGSEMDFMGSHLYIADDGCIRNKDTDLYAGPSLKMNEQLRLLVEDAGIPWNLAIQSCTINPATYLGIADHKGRIRAGYDADIVVLDNDFAITSTFVHGKCCY